jgi:hypothetical protein
MVQLRYGPKEDELQSSDLDKQMKLDILYIPTVSINKGHAVFTRLEDGNRKGTRNIFVSVSLYTVV